MKSLVRKFELAVFCLLLLPAAAFADGMVVDSCGNSGNIGNPPNNIAVVCALPGGGTAQYTGTAQSGLNNFRNVGSPVTITGVAGQVTNFTLTITSNPVWNRPGPVPTVLTANGSATVNPGASVSFVLTGTLGGPPLVISQTFTANSVFSLTTFGNQAIANAAVMTLEVTINGNATLVFPNSAEFEGAIPEPATLFLFGTGLAGIAMKMRRRLRKR